MVICLIAVGNDAQAEDWPRWRGPRADGTWNGPALKTSWEETDLAVMWQCAVGGGYSGIAVANGFVYLQDRLLAPEDSERLLCVDASSGNPVFEDRYAVKYHDDHDRSIDHDSGPRATPTIYQGLVYTLGAMGELRCLNARTGQLIWRKHLLDDLNGRLSTWGYSASPLIVGNSVIVQPGGENGWHVVALDRLTGAIQWHVLSDEAGYATPVLGAHASGPLLILWTPSHIRGVDPHLGTPLWDIPYEVKYGVSIADPILFDDLVFVSGYWEGSKMIRLGKMRTQAELLWEEDDVLHGLMSQPIQHDGYAYLLDKRHGLTCFHMPTGQKKWDDAHALTPRGRNPQASLVWLSGSNRCLALNADGILVLTELSPEQPIELARQKIIGKTWAHPAFADSYVYARSDTELVCIALPVKKED
ncbi:MAG: PQQ-like beta-propeller repeat protein [Pirellulaceae bacterium]|nr:PQQ-like beta-propeller repeat protein [Pirellulaceae bacterium]